jgi:hypothetical protein
MGVPSSRGTGQVTGTGPVVAHGTGDEPGQVGIRVNQSGRPKGLGRGEFADLEGPGEGAAHDQLLVLGRQALDDLGVGEWVG